MKTFQIGDRVRVVRDELAGEFGGFIGDTGTITGMNNDGEYQVKFDNPIRFGRKFYFRPSELVVTIPAPQQD